MVALLDTQVKRNYWVGCCAGPAVEFGRRLQQGAGGAWVESLVCCAVRMMLNLTSVRCHDGVFNRLVPWDASGVVS